MESFRPPVAPDLGALKIDEHVRSPRSGGKWWRWVLVLLVVAVLVSAALLAFRTREPLVDVAAVSYTHLTLPTTPYV